jgi:hypothetical protein
MKDIVIIVLLLFITVLLLLRRTSTYPPGTAATDQSILSQPVFDANQNYQDINPSVAPWTTASNYVLETTPGVTWNQANFNCWARTNCIGIRHNFDTKQTWYLINSAGTIGTTQTSVLSVLNPTVQYQGAAYSLPLAIVALKSVNDPVAPTNCAWSPSTPACAPAPCNTQGVPVTTTWSISTPAAHQGTCSPAPANVTNACPPGSQCPWLPFTALTSASPGPAGSPAPVYTF